MDNNPYAPPSAELDTGPDETEGSFTLIVVAALFVVFFATLFIATRITLDPETARAPRPPAPPIAWSWDGVNRQPDADEDGGSTTEAHH